MQFALETAQLSARYPKIVERDAQPFVGVGSWQITCCVCGLRRAAGTRAFEQADCPIQLLAFHRRVLRVRAEPVVDGVSSQRLEGHRSSGDASVGRAQCYNAAYAKMNLPISKTSVQFAAPH